MGLVAGGRNSKSFAMGGFGKGKSDKGKGKGKSKGKGKGGYDEGPPDSVVGERTQPHKLRS